MLLATYFGGVAVCSDPKSAKILERGKSRDPVLARNRGVLTALGMNSWYTEELKPGSK